ncbi:MAG: Fluoroacetyl-CoA thioesterase [Alphaproteobacteria bacterium MarineAlpha4_Bin2]|nr:MAG: Fluoroacetyl-CoA thioesterase [Alphaproteobacteria bacterium MarineAlpha4_Bin2]|tara:strand:- start:295 stop:720 length:426 start_codon:yes stop_codon:yes gene_type:complete
MKETLKSGVSFTAKALIEKDKTIGFMGEDLRVYATPFMVQDAERSCRNFMLEHLEDGEDTVGSRVEIDHLGPTLVGQTIEIAGKVLEVEGPRVLFEIEIRDELDTVGRVRHTRFVVEKARQGGRLEKKKARLAEAGVERNL